MTASREIAVLRDMAWQRAKGELHSLYATYYDEAESFDEVEKAVESFIKKMEDKLGF